MKPATVKQLKDELKYLSNDELVNLCLRLSRFKKENKELLSYLLFEANNESGYIEGIKQEIDLVSSILYINHHQKFELSIQF